MWRVVSEVDWCLCTELKYTVTAGWSVPETSFLSFFFPLMLHLSSAALICAARSRRLTTNVKTSLNRGWLNIADVLNSVRRRFNQTVKKKNQSTWHFHGVVTSFSVWEIVLNNWQTNKEPVFIFKWSKSQGCLLVRWTGRWTHPWPKSQSKRLLSEMNWSLCD